MEQSRIGILIWLIKLYFISLHFPNLIIGQMGLVEYYHILHCLYQLLLLLYCNEDKNNKCIVLFTLLNSTKNIKYGFSGERIKIARRKSVRLECTVMILSSISKKLC